MLSLKWKQCITIIRHHINPTIWAHHTLSWKLYDVDKVSLDYHTPPYKSHNMSTSNIVMEPWCHIHCGWSVVFFVYITFPHHIMGSWALVQFVLTSQLSKLEWPHFHCSTLLVWQCLQVQWPSGILDCDYWWLLLSTNSKWSLHS